MPAVAMADTVERYLSRFETLEKDWAGRDPGWLRPVRKAAIARFVEIGFPTARDEEWRFTKLAPLTNRFFDLPEDGPDSPNLDGAAISARSIPGIEGPLLAFVDGRYAPELSTLPELAGGLRVASLAETLRRDADSLKELLAGKSEANADAFRSLGSAFLQDGAYVRVPAGTVAEAPIRLLFVSSGAADMKAIHLRNLIVAERGSEVTIVQHYLSLRDHDGFTNVGTDVVVGENASVTDYRIEEEGPKAIHVSNLEARLGRDGRFASHAALLGGALVRNNVHPVLDGEGCDCLLNGLYLADGQEQIDNHMRVEHAKPHGSSRQFFRGILDGHARGIFAGRIIVARDAQKTDAKQNNSNLLLSEHAEADSKPQLEIYADDVKCTHGATVGQINEEALFYLRSRGIDEAAARNLLIDAFATECIDRMELESVRDYLKAFLARRLHAGVKE